MSQRSKCIGTGLVALDAILNGNPATPAKLSAGGSCGNVLTILSYLGWKSYPYIRLANDEAAELLLRDLKNWGVDVSWVIKEDKGSTPIIIHRIFRDKSGNPKHRFEFRDPQTKKWLPSYRPLLSRELVDKANDLPRSEVFYFDRISRASIELAKHHYVNGSLVVFEPSSIGNEKLFEECLMYANVIKFSNERIATYKEKYSEIQVDLEIETLGKNGLNYRFRSDNWLHSKGYLVDNIIDSAGAGDWCTAGIIDKLGHDGLHGFNQKNSTQIKGALNFGQLLGAINCMFDGARGTMYNIAKASLEKLVRTYQRPEREIKSVEFIEESWDKPQKIYPNRCIEVASLSNIV